MKMRNARLTFVALIVCALIGFNATTLRADVLVSSRLSNQVLRYSDAGAPLGQFNIAGALQTPNGVLLGPDGKIYVASRDGHQILRYFTDGQFDRVFASGMEMVGPSGIVFGPNGDLFVGNSLAQNVGRYDHTTGALVRTYGSSAELNAPLAVAFGPDADIYVTSAVNNRLVRYDGASGDFKSIVAQGGLLANPADMKRGADGRLYIASALQNRIAVYDPITSQLTSFVQDANFQGPVGLSFGPNDDLFVASCNGDKVVRVNHLTQTIAGDFISGGTGGLDGAQYLTFIPEPGFAMIFGSSILLLRRRNRR
jgi:streptogramin lyase